MGYYNKNNLEKLKVSTMYGRFGNSDYHINKKRKEDNLLILANDIISECAVTTSVFSTLRWLEQKGMLNGKSVEAYLKFKGYVETDSVKENNNDNKRNGHLERWE